MGELAELQAPQIPNAYIEDIADNVEAKMKFFAAFNQAELGEHAKLAPVNNDLQAAQIANAYLDDTDPVAAARADHMAAFRMAMEPLAEPEAEPAVKAAVVPQTQPYGMWPSVAYQQPYYLPLHYSHMAAPQAYWG
jgi:hypothetical protein